MITCKKEENVSITKIDCTHLGKDGSSETAKVNKHEFQTHIASILFTIFNLSTQFANSINSIFSNCFCSFFLRSSHCNEIK